MGNDRNLTYSDLRSRMERVGFVFEKEQKPHLQNRPENELKFIHPGLDEKFASTGRKNLAKKFYVKPLSDDEDSEIGLTTGKTSPLFALDDFASPNAIDTFQNGQINAWVNRPQDLALNRLLCSIENYLSLTLNEFNEQFLAKVNRSLSKSSARRKERLAKAARLPQKMVVNVTAYVRNPDVVAEALNRAGGYCESCNKQAPFIRKKDGSPYLEVHHVVPLSVGGEDTLDNVISLCPNCHREKHFG